MTGEVHKWLGQELAERQRRIQDFIRQNDPELAREFLALVKAPHTFGLYASIGPNYQYAVFGRDSIKAAEDLLTTNPAIVKEIILALARLQGEQLNLVSEEENGKMHHEYRALHFNGHAVPKAAVTVFKKLSAIWGGNNEELLYYGTFDATPLYIRLVSRYCEQEGSAILDEIITSHRGTRKSTLHQCVRQATAWLVSKVTASPWNQLEFKRLNLAGLYNQSWEDSNVAFLHKDGSVANADDGIAAVEIQGYVYDALRAAAELVARNEQEVNSLRHLASIVRDNFLEHQWMPHKYFAMGLDRAQSGKTRQIDTLSINAALLLQTDIFTLMPPHLSWPYIEGIVRTIFSEDFVTTAGLRLRALSQAHLVSYADYHGSLVSWPQATYSAAKGLRKQGFFQLADLLEDCILHAVSTAGEFYEFFFVDPNGRTKYHYRQELPDEPSFHDFGAANLPEPGQAWTITAVLDIVHRRHNPSPRLPVTSQIRTLEDAILQQPHIKKLLSSLN